MQIGSIAVRQIRSVWNFSLLEDTLQDLAHGGEPRAAGDSSAGCIVFIHVPYKRKEALG